MIPSKSNRRWQAVAVSGIGLLALLASLAIPTSEGAEMPPQKEKAKVGKATTSRGPRVLPKTGNLPAKLEYDWRPLVFDNGVPVGGWMHLTIRQDGSYTFTGHFHDSGFVSYDTLIFWGLKDTKNQVYGFTHQGHVSGTFMGGSRNDDWTVNGKNPDIAKNWASIAAGRSYGHAATGLNLKEFSDALTYVLGNVAVFISVYGLVTLSF
jgi:hypothetical protein